MSTQTFQSSASLVNALLEHFRPAGKQTYQMQYDQSRVVIEVVPEPTAPQDSPGAESADARRQEMLDWIKSIAKPVGLSDYAVSRESIYSPDE
jgi:hypothetical protein